MWNPVCCLLWEPNHSGPVATPTVYADASCFPNQAEGLGHVHGPGATLGSVGGNVTFMKYQQFQAEQNNPLKNLLWWATDSADGR